VKKRPRRRYDEIERLYQCSWPDCSKAYGTLNHLNAHVTMQKHGSKRSPNGKLFSFCTGDTLATFLPQKPFAIAILFTSLLIFFVSQNLKSSENNGVKLRKRNLTVILLAAFIREIALDQNWTKISTDIIHTHNITSLPFGTMPRSPTNLVIRIPSPFLVRTGGTPGYQWKIFAILHMILTDGEKNTNFRDEPVLVVRQRRGILA
jgi:hypothetical protein